MRRERSAPRRRDKMARLAGEKRSRQDADEDFPRLPNAFRMLSLRHTMLELLVIY